MWQREGEQAKLMGLTLASRGQWLSLKSLYSTLLLPSPAVHIQLTSSLFWLNLGRLPQSIYSPFSPWILRVPRPYSKNQEPNMNGGGGEVNEMIAEDIRDQSPGITVVREASLSN